MGNRPERQRETEREIKGKQSDRHPQRETHRDVSKSEMELKVRDKIKEK